MAFKLLVNRTGKKTCVVEFSNYCVSHNKYGHILSIILHKPCAPIRRLIVMIHLKLDGTECVIKDMPITFVSPVAEYHNPEMNTGH